MKHSSLVKGSSSLTLKIGDEPQGSSNSLLRPVAYMRARGEMPTMLSSGEMGLLSLIFRQHSTISRSFT
jgi:hypothetical protein